MGRVGARTWSLILEPDTRETLGSPRGSERRDVNWFIPPFLRLNSQLPLPATQPTGEQA